MSAVPPSRFASFRMLAAAVLLAIVPVVRLARDELRAAAVLTRSTGETSWLTHRFDGPVRIEMVTIPSASGPIRARVYRSTVSATAPGIVLLHGVQYLGIDEPRLDHMASGLVGAGVTVLAPELTSLANYRLDPIAIEESRAAVRHLATDPRIYPHRVALAGASFAGGLALAAACDPDTRARLAAVLTLGAHHSVASVVRYLVGESLRTGAPAPNPYGLLVFVHTYAEHFVAPAELDAFRAALREQLYGNYATSQRASAALSVATRAFYVALVRGELSLVAPTIRAALPALEGPMAALSPAGHLAALRGLPVFLLHGARDNVVPPSESEALAREIDATSADLLITRAIDHVEVGGAVGLAERLRVAHRLARLFAVLR